MWGEVVWGEVIKFKQFMKQSKAKVKLCLGEVMWCEVICEAMGKAK